MREAVARLLRAMSDARREAGDRVRARVYAQAAGAVEAREDFEQLHARGRLQAIAGVGPSVEAAIVAFLERGELPVWLEDPSRAPPPLRGRAPSRWTAPSEAYFRAPFADAPDLHVHTDWSDGTLSVEEVARRARELGAPAVGITDHSASLRIAHGLSVQEVREQWLEIERVQAEFPDVLLLRGMECDILRDGALDAPGELLAELDFVVASLHSHLQLDSARQTMRVLRALDSPHVTVLGHPTTRVPGRRQPASLDLDRVFAKAAKRGVALEVNGNPGRLDLDVELAGRALAAGCKLSCSSDGHTADEMLAFATAREMAAAAGARPEDLVNYALIGGPPRATGRSASPS